MDLNRIAAFDRLVMTPGPTMVDERVRRALALPLTNPDLDPEFARFYAELCRRLQGLLRTRSDVLVLAGEGLLGLEAAVASLVEPGDRVLCVANGVYGEGFAEFVRLYGGEPVLVPGPYDRPVEPRQVEEALARHPGIKVATVVHCETPAGLINPVQELCPLLKERGVVTVVDAVSSIAGEPLEVDAWGIDVALGAPQKCLSAPPGLAFLTVSADAWRAMEARRAPIRGYYLNLLQWRRSWLERGEFPYTPSSADLAALAAAVALVEEEGLERVIARHRRIARAVRTAVRAAGLDLYPVEEAAAHAVTALRVPDGVDDADFRRLLWERHGVMIAGSWGPLAGRVWRIGHMGANARDEHVVACLAALDRALPEAGVRLRTSLAEAYLAAAGASGA